jgi:hypothetical protein
MPSEVEELFGPDHERVGNVASGPIANLDADRVDQHEPLDLVGTADRYLGGNPAAHAQPHQVDGLGAEIAQQIEVAVGEVVDRVEVAWQVGGAKARMRWRDHREVPRQGLLVRLPLVQVLIVVEHDYALALAAGEDL